MKFVEPLKDQNLIEEIGRFLWKKRASYGLFYYIGINSALRVSDIIDLRVKDLVGTHIEVNEKKSRREEKIIKFVNKEGQIEEKLVPAKPGKRKKILITQDLRAKINEYLRFRYQDQKIPLDDFLFQNKTGAHITRQMANKILKKAAKKFNLTSFSAHSLRKTFATKVYKETNDLALIVGMLNHRNMSDTLRYLGITQDSYDSVLSKFSYTPKENKNVG